MTKVKVQNKTAARLLVIADGLWRGVMRLCVAPVFFQVDKVQEGWQSSKAHTRKKDKRQISLRRPGSETNQTLEAKTGAIALQNQTGSFGTGVES